MLHAGKEWPLAVLIVLVIWSSMKKKMLVFMKESIGRNQIQIKMKRKRYLDDIFINKTTHFLKYCICE